MPTRACQRVSSSLSMAGAGDKSYHDWLRAKEEQRTEADRIGQIEESRRALERRLFEERRQVQSELSYLQWLERKNVERLERRRRDLEEERVKAETLRLEDERLKKETEEKFAAWKARKDLEERTRRSQEEMAARHRESESRILELNRQSAEAIWQLWASKKKSAERVDKLKKAAQLAEMERKEREKRELSEKKLAEWMKASKTKPKPTKSNLGLLSLSSSNVGFVNPIPWCSALEEEDSAGWTKSERPLKSNSAPTSFSAFRKEHEARHHREVGFTADTCPECNSIEETLERTADWVRRTKSNVAAPSRTAYGENRKCLSPSPLARVVTKQASPTVILQKPSVLQKVSQSSGVQKPSPISALQKFSQNASFLPSPPSRTASLADASVAQDRAEAATTLKARQSLLDSMVANERKKNKKKAT